ncbi:glutathione S-transferase [Methylobacterium sp. J-030]|uniref:glutathione S-transferase n=1 Tax=Methylobacterium sp. J-030 TaxID=2836627 RepID=UPI001FB8A94C|nr:glutathione S-transferase [Methylobacterium sp. J-030]MCJ2069466.1 glutathione S-transferase [Methylobacterium sp. J-030]
MKLFYSPSSPFVRKVMIAAHELGLVDRLERQPAAAHPVKRDAAIRAENPLGQVPTLITDDGLALFDSRVICEYLDAQGGGALFGTGATRWRNLAGAAMGDGLLNAALLARYEGAVRPEALRWSDWTDGQMSKVTDVLAVLDRTAPEFGDRVDIATITLACALGYLDFRYPSRDWRGDHPAAAAWYAAFAERPSLVATQPRD